MERKNMRKNFGAKAILYPMPVLIIGTYDENGKANAMNAAWGGISEETQISICIDDGHKTAKNVVKAGAFTVSIADADNVVACDYVGIVSGNKEPDKIEKAGWHVTKSEFVNAPLFDELPMEPAEKKKGCASAVQPGLLLLMIATLPVVTVRRKKETE